MKRKSTTSGIPDSCGCGKVESRTMSTGSSMRTWIVKHDASIYLVDGPRRLDLARRTGTSQVPVQYLPYDSAGEAFGKGILINIAQWVFDSGAKVEMACACRRQALAKAFGERRIDPASEVAEELFEYFPDLKAKYGSPERGV